ncbi:MAG TPA: zinc ribbon domain-containing protein [Pirellulales bacterium]|nr:zinc ribbon domain-containing protein [Pirellulales bacterium]
MRRLLVACPQCKRQYDATQLGVGTRFHCRCGQILTVPAPQSQEAKPVCCSHCGAPRTEGALSCAYCGAEFSLHDRDLDTVCPHCFARVSNQARFCEFCGAAIHPETTAGDASQLVCPACGEGHVLSSRALGDVSTMECQRCGGLWLSHASFQQLTEQAAQQGLNIDPRLTPTTARAPHADAPPPDGDLYYRHCPTCQQLMIRQNYGHGSSVIIDICGRHGVWLDADDLPRIIQWIHDGGLVRANQVSVVQQQQAAEELHAKAVAEAKLIERGPREPADDEPLRFLGGSAGRILELMAGLVLLLMAGLITLSPDSGLSHFWGNLLAAMDRMSTHHQNVMLGANHNAYHVVTAGIMFAVAGTALLWHSVFRS